MKKTSHLIAMFAGCSFTVLVNAYEYSFYNNTNDPIGIAIQYTGNDTNEPLYKQLVKPNSMVTFTPGKIKIPEIKWGFCLNNIYYIQNPTTEQKVHDFEKTTWRKIPTTWVKEKSTTKRKEKKQPPIEQKVINPTVPAEKSLCRDRHFDIIQDEHGKISITASLNE